MYELIKKEDIKNIENKMEKLIPYYVPEWKPNFLDPDAGTALFLIFKDMYMNTLDRLNQIPQKHFMEFLNMSGAKLKEPECSFGSVLFNLAEGMNSSVLVKKGVKLYSNIEDETILFESDETVLITPAKIESVYVVGREDDFIEKIPNNILSEEVKKEEVSYTVFEDAQKNVQEHIMYIKNDDLFYIKNESRIELKIGSESIYIAQKNMELLQNKVLWEYYDGESWTNLLLEEVTNEKVVLKKEDKKEVKEYEVNGEKGYFIRVRAKKDIMEELEELYIDDISISLSYCGEEGISAGKMYYNDVPLEVKEDKKIKPFGEAVNIFDMFYISNEEVFSKRGAQIILDIKMDFLKIELLKEEKKIDWKLIIKASDMEAKDENLMIINKVVWEYWNGFGWSSLNVEPSSEICFNGERNHIKVCFKNPENMQKTFVNDREAYWIRVRITSIKGMLNQNTSYLIPEISRLKLKYDYEQEHKKPQTTITYNNLEYKELEFSNKDKISYNPFYKLESEELGMYINLNQKLYKGPFNIGFDVIEKGISDEDKMVLKWEYFSEGRWKMLKNYETTEGFTKSGTLKMFFEEEFTRRKMFGEKGYWIRAEIKQKYGKKLSEVFRLPTIKGIHINTVDVSQKESISEEILNPSPLVDKLKVKTFKHPVVELELWVDETEELSQGEISEIDKNNDLENKIEISEFGEVEKIWIKWAQVENLYFSKGEDRHFTLNKNTGEISFGNGVKGKKPPMDLGGTIVANYKVGGGSIGNLAAGELKELENAIPFVDSVYNLNEIEAGCDVESTKRAILRSTEQIRHRRKIVSKNDFESVIKDASVNIAKVKCIEKFKTDFKLDVVVLPQNGMRKSSVFEKLKFSIENYIKDKLPAWIMIEDITVVEPVYVEISVEAKLRVKNFEEAVEVDLNATSKLAEFLNPLTGGYEKSGWDIGEVPHESMLYGLLSSVKNVVDVEDLSIYGYKHQYGEITELDEAELYKLKSIVIFNGTHKIKTIVY